VAPGQTLNISVDMTAPNDAGNYRGFWQMRNAAGQLFETSVYVDIDVVGAGTPSSSENSGTSGTPTATGSPAPSGALVSGLTMSVDNSTVTDSCPYEFTFNAQFDLDEDATVTYRLEAGADSAGFEIDVPDPVTTELDSGRHTLVYTLEFSASISGWARLHITAPNDVVSNQATYALTCE
jgi:hypothetical protein